VFLEKIVTVQREAIRKRKTLFPQREMEERARCLPRPRNLLEALSQANGLAVIAEIKPASPSAGTIREGVEVPWMAKQYEEGGACAISVLTEPRFFHGNLRFLPRVKETVSLPVLQKDFIIDPFQIYEGRTFGADALLLIAAILGERELKELAALTFELGMVPLVEAHNEEDLEKILKLSLPLVGLNNRDLKTLEVNLETTLRLLEKVPREIMVISESGIKSGRDVEMLKKAGVKGILVGEILMRASSPASKIKELLNP
jgi:indole-3-glycerol phosphate synthase